MCFFKKRRERKRAIKAEQERLAQEKEQKVVEPVVVKPSKEIPVSEKPAIKEEKPKSTTPPKYHVSQNKDEGTENFKKWRVRKEGSTKTIKFFDTQKEAIAYAEDLASNSGSSVVIHKVDGSIRKQDYAKKV